MYSRDDLLQLLKSEKADELRLRAGKPRIIVLEGEQRVLEGPAITIEEAWDLLQSIANSRPRRELRQRGILKFIYRFRRITDFVISARLEDESVEMDVQ